MPLKMPVTVTLVILTLALLEKLIQVGALGFVPSALDLELMAVKTALKEMMQEISFKYRLSLFKQNLKKSNFIH
jgi:hypothetical protein